jgi:hypothetical protein
LLISLPYRLMTASMRSESGSSLCHLPGDHPLWQESMAMLFRDDDAGVGGTLAFGTFVNQGHGINWVGLYGDRPKPFRYQRSRIELPLVDGDRTDTVLGVGGVHWIQLAEGRGRLVGDSGGDGEVGVDLELTDLYPPASWHEGDGGPLADLGAGHVETSCRVTGAVRVQGEEVAVDGLGHRDQSWGPRTLDIVRNHRWVAGTCGPALSFSLEVLHVAGAPVQTFGFVVRDGERSSVADVEILVTLDHDGLTPRRYESNVTLASGEELTVVTDTIHAVLYNHRGPLTAIDALATVTAGGLTGTADLNIITNPLNGADRPTVLLGGSVDDGLIWL